MQKLYGNSHFCVYIQFYWNTVMTTYFHFVCGYFWTTAAEWNNCNRYHVETKPNIFTFWPFTVNLFNTWSRLWGHPSIWWVVCTSKCSKIRWILSLGSLKPKLYIGLWKHLGIKQIFLGSRIVSLLHWCILTLFRVEGPG